MKAADRPGINHLILIKNISYCQIRPVYFSWLTTEVSLCGPSMEDSGLLPQMHYIYRHATNVEQMVD